MKLQLKYDPFIEDLLVSYTDPTGTVQEQTVRDFYVEARKTSGMNISALERQCGINHPALANIENKQNANPLKPMLIALLELGYVIELEKSAE